MPVALPTQVPWTDIGQPPCCCGDDPTLCPSTPPPFVADVEIPLTATQVTLFAAGLVVAQWSVQINSWNVTDNTPYVTLDPAIDPFNGFVSLPGSRECVCNSVLTSGGQANPQGNCEWNASASGSVSRVANITQRWLSGCIGSDPFKICGTGQIVSTSVQSVNVSSSMAVYIRRHADSPGGLMGIRVNAAAQAIGAGSLVSTAVGSFQAGTATISGNVLGQSVSESKFIRASAFNLGILSASASMEIVISVVGQAP